MRFILPFVLSCSLGMLWAADWASQSGNPQRDGWARGETDLIEAKVQDIKLLYRTKLDNQSRGADSLTSPVVLTNLITYRGFKEMLFVGGSSDNVYSIDAALNNPLWKTHFDYKSDQPQAKSSDVCPGGLTASIAIMGGSSPMERRFRPTRRAAPATSPGVRPAVGPGQGGAAHRPGAPADYPAAPSAGIFTTGFGRNGYVFAIGSDGYLRFVRQPDGNDKAVAPVKFLPPNAKATGINISGTVVYAATVDGCGGNPNALYAIDLGKEAKQVVSLATNGGGLTGEGGTAIGMNGTVYAEVESGHGDVAGAYNSTVLALDHDSLTVTDYFTPAGTPPPARNSRGARGMTPAFFHRKGKDLVVAGAADGTIYLLDAASLGGPDHHTPLCRTKALGNLWGDFSTWEDTESNTQWIYAALRGPAAESGFPAANGTAPDGGIVAFKLEEQNGKPELVPAWASRNMIAPESPVTTNGMVFALSTGDSPREGQRSHATLYVLDGANGKELFSSGDDAATFSHGSGLALANGRVYFTTHDNTVYCYGRPDREPQLTER